MPRAGPSRSQRQPSQAQSQRHGRTQRHVEDEEDEEEVVFQNYDDDEEGGLDGTGGGTVRAPCQCYPSSPLVASCPTHFHTQKQDLKKRATDLVRLALFQEQRRMPLRRDDISKRVIGSQRGAFKAVFDEAQKILRGTFGMELVELPTRAATHETAAAAGGATDKDRTQNGEEGAGDRQTITGLKKKGAVLHLLALPLLGGRIYLIIFALSVQPSRRVPRRTSFVRHWILR
jgi:melanoma-associated antigen